MMIAIFGTMQLLMAFTSLAPDRIIPACSLSRPTMNPVVSWKNTIGIRFWLQSMMNRAAFSAESV